MPTQKYCDKSGNKVPSVTTVIGTNLGWNKNALFYWAIKMMRMGIDPITERDKAAELGTLIHAYIEAYIYGTVVEQEIVANYLFDDVVVAERGLEQFKIKEKEMGIEWLESEFPLVSDDYKYGGCLDGVCKIGNEIVLLDTKSSNDIYADHIIQLGAYLHLLEECTDYKPTRVTICKVNKDKETILADEDIVKFIDVPMHVVMTGMDVFFGLLVAHNKKKIFDDYLKPSKKSKKVLTTN